MRIYRLSARAQRDIGRVADAFFAYAGRTPEAEKRYDAVWEAIESLVLAPVQSPRCSRWTWARERVVSGCKIYYFVDPDTGENVSAGDVFILRIRLPGELDPDQL